LPRLRGLGVLFAQSGKRLVETQ